MQKTDNKAWTNISNSANALYIAIVMLTFAAITLLFLVFPRPTYSELEKRELATFPNIDEYSDNLNAYTEAISHWFSDAQPYRDEIMTASMLIRQSLRYPFANEEDAISFKAAETSTSANDLNELNDSENPNEIKEALKDDDSNVYNGNDDVAKIDNAGIVIIGKGDRLRALMTYGGSATSGQRFAESLNLYADSLHGVNIYVMPIPTAVEFYLPEKARKLSTSQRTMFDTMRNLLAPSIKYIDAYSTLANHTGDSIYLRTDHHWAPLGAYYAARTFAHTAAVDFKELTHYNQHTIHRYVGTMYGYSKDISVKQSPENFVYHTPQNSNYTTTIQTYTLDNKHNVTAVTRPYKGQFFHHHKDGSTMAYLTFMGGDMHFTKVETGVASKRKLLIIKDSFGNALPGYLFFSFGEIHVADFRYFHHNVKNYIAEHNISDLLIVFNTFNVSSSSANKRLRRLLTQQEKVFATAEKATPAAEKSKPIAEKSEKSATETDMSATKIDNATTATNEALPSNKQAASEPITHKTDSI